MEDKNFELLTRIYSELISFKKETGERFDRIEDEVHKTQIIIEHDIKQSINALYDGYKQNHEILQDHGLKLDEISSKLDNHEVEIKALKGGKAKKTV